MERRGARVPVRASARWSPRCAAAAAQRQWILKGGLAGGHDGGERGHLLDAAEQALTELAVQELAQDLALNDAVGDSLELGDKLVEPGIGWGPRAGHNSPS